MGAGDNTAASPLHRLLFGRRDPGATPPDVVARSRTTPPALTAPARRSGGPGLAVERSATGAAGARHRGVRRMPTALAAAARSTATLDTGLAAHVLHAL